MTVRAQYQQIEFSLLGELRNTLRGRSDLVNQGRLRRLQLEKRADRPDHGLGVIVVAALGRRLAGESGCSMGQGQDTVKHFVLVL